MNTKTILDKIRTKVSKGQEWLLENLQYLTIMGSHAYGTNTKDSDWDVYGFTIPPREYIFPDFINGFEKPPTFDQFQGQFKEGPKNEHLDFQIYNITKYFYLVKQGNPNMTDSLWTKPNCELIITPIGRTVKENRKIFLHKGLFHRFKGYAFSQMNKIKTKPDERANPERKALIEKYGYDCKFALHLFRLLGEAEQLLITGDMDLTLNREQLKRVKQGLYTLPEVENYFKEKELMLEKAYADSALPYGPREEEIRELLINCLNLFYGEN